MGDRETDGTEMSRSIRFFLALLVFGGAVTLARPASACPMCKVANEENLNLGTEARPKAYMYSILFMLSMPATLFTGFGVTFYRLSKKQQALNATILNDDELIG